MSRMKSDFTTVHEALQWASLFLRTYQREEKVAEILLMHHTGMGKANLLASLREPLKKEIKKAFIKDIEQHAKTAVPVQHLTGKEEFYGRSFLVNRHVLIPRPETEELVHGIIEIIKRKKPKKRLQVVDLGTGSGVIAVSLKLECPEMDVYATDISKEALTVAHKNATNLEADVHFFEGDFLQPFIDQGERFDIIVSNPPYISEKERSSLSTTVKNYDPSLALFAQEEGLAAYRKIVEQVKQVTMQKALLALEIGSSQGGAVTNIILKHFPQAQVEVKKDINGRDRMVFAFLEADSRF